jgi:hypothetical protein
MPAGLSSIDEWIGFSCHAPVIKPLSNDRPIAGD